MYQTRCLKEFCAYVSLNILGMIGLSCYILADTFFVSKALGTNGLAALNLAIPVYSFIHGSGLMIGMGGATKYSILKSQNQQRAADHVFTNAAALAAGFGVVFVLLGVCCSGTIVRLLGANQAVYQMSKTYLQVILLFAPMFLFNNVLLCFVRNDGAPQRSMAAMIGGSLSNIVLDYVFMFPFGMGIFGAVLATGLAPVVSMMILSPHFIRRKNGFHFVKCRMTVVRSVGILSSGFPSFVTEVSSGVVMIVFNMIILGLEGNIGVAAYGVIANVSLVVLSIYTGIAQGVQPMISRYYGAKRPDGVKTAFRYAMVTMLGVSGIVYACVFFGASLIAEIFNSGQDPFFQKIAVEGLRIYFAACPFAGLNIILSVYFTSTAYARPAHIISLLRGFVMILPMVFLLSELAGITGVWCSFPATEFLVGVTGVLLYVFSKRQRSSDHENARHTPGKR